MSGLAVGEKMTAEHFLRDIANHKMTVRLDNGIYRHLEFRQATNSWNLWFGIVTWPGYLTICGDMGTWTFRRLEDMFGFFRDKKLRINADYWAEKLEHGQHGGRDGAKQFSEDLFRGRLLEQLTEYYSLEGAELATVTEALRNDVLRQDGKYDLMIAARDFSCKLPSGKFEFDPCELPDGKEYTYHFLWCLYAIVWGIQQYDAVRAGRAVTA
jgi:hypothetical protein